MDASALIAAYHDTKQEGLRPFPGVREGFRDLHAKTQLVLGVITEGLAVKQSEKILRLGIYPYLDRGGVFISDTIGISKPNPKLWLRACTTAGVSPAEAMYVGDHPENDIAPAKAIGMVAVRHRWQGGKHAREEGTVKADYEIRGFQELIPILRDDFGFAKL